MGKLDRRLQRSEAPVIEIDEEAEAKAWAFVYAWMLRHVTITANDRLHLLAGEGEEGDLAPAEVRRDPERLLKWCEVFQPEMILDDVWAAHNALNRVSYAELGLPGAGFSHVDRAEFIRREGLDA